MTGSWTDSSRWPLVGLGKVAEVQLGKMLQPQPLHPDDQPTHYLRAGSLAELTNLGELPTMFASPRDKKMYAVVPGDLIVAEGGDVGRPEFVPEVPPGAIIQNSLHRVRPNPAAAEARFLKYALESIYLSNWLDVLCNRSTFGHLTLEKLRSLQLPLPSTGSQRAIADFLDAETARIDTLIAKKKQLIALLVLRGEAAGSKLVMSEEDGCRTPLSSVFRITKGIDAQRITAEYCAANEGPYPVYSGQTKGEFGSIDTFDFSIPGGAIVVSTVGARVMNLTVVRGRFSLSQNCLLLIPHVPSQVRVEYFVPQLRHLFRGLRASIPEHMQPSLRVEDLRGKWLRVPPTSAQEEIVKRLAEIYSSTSRGVEMTTRHIELLRERRQALIMAAVTGEFEVPGVAA